MNQNNSEKSNASLSGRSIAKYIVLSAAMVLCLMYSGQIFGLARNLWGIVFPLVLGCALAYILNIIMEKFEKIYFPKSNNKVIKKTRTPAILILSILSVLAVLFFVIRMVVPELVKTVSSLAVTIPEIAERVSAYLAATNENPMAAEFFNNLQIDWENIGTQIISFATQGFSGIVTSAFSIVSGFAGAIFSFFISFSFAIYILVGKHRLKGQLKRVAKAFLPQKIMGKVSVILNVAHESFTSFFVGQFIEAIILGGLCTLGMLLFRFPYATAVGAFVGVTALIPVFGAWIGAAVGAVLILVVSPVKAVMFLVFIVILQQLENNLIYPRVVGTSVGLPGIWVLAAITIGGGFGGVIGMLIGVPIAATIYKLLKLAVMNSGT